MKRRLNRIISIVILFMLMAVPTLAQERTMRQIYEQAESAYEEGRIEQAQKLLENNFNKFEGTLRQSVCRLLALCALGQDNQEETEKYAQLLLKENPYYTSVQDPIRFEDLIKSLRIGKVATITTASSKAETLEEVPVPVTLITEQMIQDCGADNLRDILAIYVPGMYTVEGNGEYNISMHGVYSSRQEKILVMLNGHRLNARSTNAQAPDYGISCEKIKQIEVLRGPASSLYGNVALTAVVNIITKEGRDVDGASVAGKVGSFDTYKADAIIGVNRLGMDFMSWASIYSSEGEKIDYPASATDVWRRYITDGSIRLDGFNRHPSFDLGFVLRLNDNHWQILANIKHAKMQMIYPFTIVGMSGPYNYDKYRRLDGEKPGHSRTTFHNEVSYNNSWGEWSLGASAYIDVDEYSDYDVMGDSLPFVKAKLDPVEFLDSIVLSRGVYQRQKWNDFTYGAMVKISKDYQLGGLGNGNLLVGFQGEQYRLYTSDLVIGDEYDRIMIHQAERTTQVNYGSERTLSAFAQAKHTFSRQWILNAGLRYDNKYRFNSTTETAISPRLAIIYKPSDWSFKLSYSKSFVDAPYINRASTLPSLRGGINLKPEYNHALQLSVISSKLLRCLTYDGNISYNSLTNLIYYDKTATSDQPAYINAGKVKLLSIENSLFYRNTKLRGYINFTYMNMLSSENYPTTGQRIKSIPQFTVNAVVSKSILSLQDFSLWVQAKLTYYSAQTMAVSAFRDGAPFADPEYELRASFLPDISMELKWKMISAKLQCKNIFDSKYYRGTLYNIDVPTQGRNISTTVKIEL